MFSVAILAGGKSERMGRDKALMPFMGRPLILRVFERLKATTKDIFVMTDRPDDYAFLGIPLYPDLEPGRGALGGLASALHAAENPLVAVVACDMPFASPALFEHERDRMVASDADVVIPSTAEGLEPLHAVYRRATCLPVIQGELKRGEMKVTAWLPKVKVKTLPPEVIARYDPRNLAFWNLNTLEEFRQAEAQARLEESC